MKLSTKNKKILFIDDEVSIVDLLSRYFQTKDFETVAAFDGEEGLSKFDQETPDLVILDLTMPKMSGLEFCRIIRRERKDNTPIIVLTAHGTETDRIVSRVRGADIYMTKPSTPAAILNNVSSLLHQNQN